MRPCLAPLFLWLLLAGPLLADEEPARTPTPEETARAFLAHLAAGELPAARAMLDATMTQALPPGRLAAIWQQILARAGAWEGTAEEGVERTIGPHRVVDVETTFARAVLTLRITVDGSGKVAGFFLVGERPRRDDAHTMALETETGVLHGTLDLPEGEGPWPVVLVIAGSGPTDRDGNAPGMRNDHLALLGRGLAARGTAALRYDKRGVGESQPAGPSEADLRLEMLAEDAAAWIRTLRADERFSRVVLLGHSEGSLIGMLAAQRTAPDAFVSVAGPGRPAGAILLEQLKPKLAPPLYEQAAAIVAALNAGEVVDEVPADLAPLFRESVQPYLISWFAYDPAAEIAKLQVPVLVLQGDRDVQVAAEEALRLAPDGSGRVRRILEGMNHVLKAARTEAEQARAYTDPALPVRPALLDALATFVHPAGKEVPGER